MKISKIKLNQRERVLLVVVFFVSIFAFGKYWYSKKSKEVDHVSQKIEVLRKKVNENKQLFEKSKERRVASVKKINSDFDLDNVVSSSRYLSNLLTELSGLGAQDNLSIEKIEITNSSLKNGFMKNTIKLNIRSTFLDLGQFLEKLEQSKHLLEVDSVDLTKIETDLKRCDAEVTVFGYVAR